MHGKVQPPGPVIIPKVMKRILFVDPDRQCIFSIHDVYGSLFNTSGVPYKIKNGPTLSGRTVKIPLEDSFGALLARAAHRGRKTYVFYHLGTLATPVARLPDPY